MEKLVFKDLPNTETPVTADNLNHNFDYVDEQLDTVVEQFDTKTQKDITTDGNAVKCGYKVDNKDVYVKRINFGALPNASSKTVPTGIDFSEYTLYKIEGIAKFATNNVAFPLPFSNPNTLNLAIMVNIDNSNNIVVNAGADRSGYNGVFNIYFY